MTDSVYVAARHGTVRKDMEDAKEMLRLSNVPAGEIDGWEGLADSDRGASRGPDGYGSIQSV